MIIIDSEIFKVVSIERNHTITIIIIIIFTMIIILKLDDILRYRRVYFYSLIY